jgi:nucleoside 2-deoxyribosyltransferase
MRFYIASKDQAAAREFRSDLHKQGHEVISTWLDEESYGVKKTPEQKAAIAVQDLEEVRVCDALIHRSEPDGSYVPGGKHAECGGALILGKPVYLIGKREHIFHSHPNVKQFETWDEFLRFLTTWS